MVKTLFIFYSKALNPQEMHKMGLRVTGQTGEAKLKVRLNVVTYSFRLIHMFK